MTRLNPDTKSVKSGARFHIADGLAIGAELPLTTEATHHALRVLRLSEKSAVILFDGRGGEYDAVITRIARGEVWVRATRFREAERESPLTTILIQGISSGDRMDYTIRKAVELGISRVIPVFTARSIVKLSGERIERRREHWQNLAISACEQCGRNLVPEIDAPEPYERWLSQIAREAGDELRLTLSPTAQRRLADIEKPRAAVNILAGPEGGLSGDELELAAHRGFVGVRLGPRILRTETAALAALSAMQTLWGDF